VRQRDQVSERLLESADRVLGESGIHRISVRRIVLDAEISTMNVYSRFGSLSGLLDELVVEGFRELEAALTALPPTNDVVADLVQFAGAYRAWVVEHPEKYRLMMTTGASEYEPGPPALEARQHLLDRLADAVATARAARPDDVAPMTADEAAQVVLAMLHGMLLLELDNVLTDVDSPDRWAERLAVAVRFGLSRTDGDAA
jgi:AcrR family transcriptional regulator